MAINYFTPAANSLPSAVGKARRAVGLLLTDINSFFDSIFELRLYFLFFQFLKISMYPAEVAIDTFPEALAD